MSNYYECYYVVLCCVADRLFVTVQAKYSLETQYVQAVCALLNETQRRSLVSQIETQLSIPTSLPVY